MGMDEPPTQDNQRAVLTVPVLCVYVDLYDPGQWNMEMKSALKRFEIDKTETVLEFLFHFNPFGGKLNLNLFDSKHEV